MCINNNNYNKQLGSLKWKKYLVGGAIRDFLLKLPIKEKDWVVTGSSPQEMLNIGYEQVGKYFPVFLHPKSHEEYALARTERKSGKGYTGFIFNTDPFISIEEDLYRRDLTINAMAYDMSGNLLDPYHGQRDIKLRLLRHVSDAFQDDPLRVLRVARFAARFKSMGFTIAPETLELMTYMTCELNALSTERVWMETKKALSTNNPQVYFQILRQCGGLKVLFPELDMLFSIIPNCKKWKIYYNTLGDHTMKKLYHMACLSSDLSLRFAILCCYLGESINLSRKLSIYSHLIQSEDSFVNSLCNRLKVPHNFYKLAKVISIYCNYLNNVMMLSPKEIITIFNAFNCCRHPQYIDHIIFVNKSNLLSNENDSDSLFIQENFLRAAFSRIMKIKVLDVVKDGFTGSNIKQELYNRRLLSLSKWHQNYV